jgi:4-amino-4-deoxy-L-arabinose transferase-like glycosyltransferase
VPSTRGRAIAAAAFLLYLLVSLFALDRFPTVGQDEPWIAAPAFKLATEGTLGSDLFTGYHGMERHHLVHMPVYPLLEAAIFRATGTGVAQMRTLSVAFGFALLLAVYAVGREIGGQSVATVAVLLMVLQRIAAPTAVRPIGILLLDDARINRYDIAVPAFGLVALLIVMRTADRSRWWPFVAAGGLAGLSALSHLYGAFWLATVLVFLVLRENPQRSTPTSIAAVVGGFVLVCVPWATWIGLHWQDYAGQMRTVATRFDVFTPSFYSVNILSADGPISVEWLRQTLRSLPLDRVGSWTLALGTPVAVYMMWNRPERRAVAVACAIQLPLFVALLQVKTFNYVIALWPLAALAIAWLAIELWDRRRRVIRGALSVVTAAILVEGGACLRAVAQQAKATSSYDWYESQIAACIPPGSLVLGFQHYWLGLRQFRFRTWLLPFYLANQGVEPDPLPLDVALERINPDIILIDRYARQLFSDTADPGHPFHYLALGFDAFRARRALVPLCVVRDHSYGVMEVYGVSASAPALN